MTLEQYRDCLNMLGQAAWHLQGARRVSDTPDTCGTTDEAFALARLALHAVVSAVMRQAERRYGDAAVAALGDPWACLAQQQSMLDHDGPMPFWRIA